MVNSSSDPCCQTIKCEKDGKPLIPLTVDPVTHVKPPLDPTKTNVVPVVHHPVITGHGTPTGVTPSVLRHYGGRNACVYKGQLYKPGDSWEDGCEYSCTCEPNTGGMYTCVQICGLQPPIPSYCRLIHVPGQCCNTITCDIPKVGVYVPDTIIPTITPGTVPQLKPGRVTLTLLPKPVSANVTVSGGGHPITWVQVQKVTSGCVNVKDMKAYRQGETWQDGDGMTCECVVEETGFYQCTPDCPVYNLPDGCEYSTFPGEICKKVRCNDPDTGLVFDPIRKPRPGYYVYGRYPKGTSGFRPYNVPPGVSNDFVGCYFNKQLYSEGESWQDKCSYTCTCVDGQRHTMECKSLCHRYEDVPSQCSLVNSGANHCCQTVSCPVDYITPPLPNIPTTVGYNITTGSCVDQAATNCEQYTISACAPKYHDWAKGHCPRFCGLCPDQTVEAPICEDKWHNCDQYDLADCTSPATKTLMHSNCYKTCGYCGTCQDIDDSCGQIQAQQCGGPYKYWASQMCARTCGFCNVSTPVQPTLSPTPSIPTNYTGMTGTNLNSSNWILLLKGVGGVPGDLYNLWNQPGELNENITQAHLLTPDYPGHFKSYFADNIASCQFEKIRIGIFKNGLEYGYILFDATGATKQNVFDPSRIISSKWNDIKSSSNSFSPSKDSATGREFSFGQSPQNCNSKGWMYVSTNNSCSYASDTNTLYFSPSTGAVEFKDMVKGDVLAVLAQGGKCGAAQNTPKPDIGCTNPYNASHVIKVGETYREGCTYECKCDSSLTAKCREVCLRLPNLTPAQLASCTFPTPCPGKCCAAPVCGGIPVTVPDEYKQDYC